MLGRGARGEPAALVTVAVSVTLPSGRVTDDEELVTPTDVSCVPLECALGVRNDQAPAESIL